MKVLILGSTGWVGKKVLKVAEQNGIHCLVIHRSSFWIDKNFEKKLSEVDAVVNCAGYAGRPNVDACELEKNKANVYQSNIEIPKRLAKFCKKIPIIHISSGCVYQGNQNFSEEANPNFFGSYYVVTKIKAEKILENTNCWILRPRMFFTDGFSSKNLLTKLLRYGTIVDSLNSITSLDEFAVSVAKCLKKQPPFGIYNMTHPKPVTTRRILEELGCEKNYISPEEFNRHMTILGKAQRSFTTLDASKSQRHEIGLSYSPLPLIRDYAETSSVLTQTLI